MSAKSANNFPGASMTDEGMQFNGVLFLPAVEQCDGCGRVREFEGKSFCSSYPMPKAKWSMGNCNFATHVKITQSGQVKVNPLKASKRAAKGGR